MSETIYRFEVDGIGMYEAVERDCPRDDKRREHKPDGSWLPKVGENYSGAVSYWTKNGFQKYKRSGLRDWHSSVVKGQKKFILAKRPKRVLYEDEFQIICEKQKAEVVRVYPYDYEGPEIPQVVIENDRPEFIKHRDELHDWNAYAAYKGSDESFSAGADLSRGVGLKKLGVHYEVLKPGKRTSWPHAHSEEEEIALILSGNPDIWINGIIYRTTPMDVIYFKPGTNFAHTMINNTTEDVIFLMLGEQGGEKDTDRIYYPEHPDRNQECKDVHNCLWEDRPEQIIESGVKEGKWIFQKTLHEIEQKECSWKNEDFKVYTKNRDLGRTLGAEKVALHHVTLPNGFRSSIPHAESLEEEFIYVLKGSPIAWLNGTRYPLQVGDVVGLPAGTGVLHTFINESGEDVELIVAGETWKDNNKSIYGINPELEEENKGMWWYEHPEQIIGDDSPMPSL